MQQRVQSFQMTGVQGGHVKPTRGKKLGPSFHHSLPLDNLKNIKEHHKTQGFDLTSKPSLPQKRGDETNFNLKNMRLQ